MSRVPWHLFQDRQPRAHLIVGVLALADGPPGGDDLTAAQSVLMRLVRKHKLAGDYAATVVRDTGLPEAYFAFEDEADATKLAALLKAEVTGSYPGWATQRAFQLDGAMVTALAASLPAPKTRPRHLPEDGSSRRLPTSRSTDPDHAARVSRRWRSATPPPDPPLNVPPQRNAKPGMWSRSGTPWAPRFSSPRPIGRTASATPLWQRFCGC